VRGARGFTLVETLIAMVLSSFILMLVGHAFLVQNEFYATQTLRIGAQDNTRAATELIAREVRNTGTDGLVVAGPYTLTLRSPMVIGVVCDRLDANTSDVMTEGGPDALETGAVAGVALRNDSTWEYRNSSWASLDGSDTQSPINCASNGADTVGARDDFHRLTGLNGLWPSGLAARDVFMLFRETTFTIRTSQLDTTRLGLFRADYGASPVEFATGIDDESIFGYRTSAGTFLDTIAASGLADVDAVRITVGGNQGAATGGAGEVRFGWSVVVPFLTVREGGN
jgi:prepilin-type N-terminal cleavage/methylation domain-containing protein